MYEYLDIRVKRASQWKQMSLAIDVLVKPACQMPRPPTSNIAANTAWDTVLTYQNIPRQQQETSQVFIAGMPSKLNSRRAVGKVCSIEVL